MMALLPRLRSLQRRWYSSSSILSPNSTTPLAAMEKTRAAISLLRSETNPERILDICRAAVLTPEVYLDRIAFSLAINKLTKFNHFEGIRQFLDELKTRPDLRTERYAAEAMILFGRAKMLDQAIRTFEEMDKLGIDRSVHSLNSLLFSCILAEDYKQMHKIYLEYPRVYNLERNLVTFARVIEGFSKSGSTTSGYSVLADMDKVGITPNGRIFEALFAGFYKEEKFEDVEKVLELMKKYKVRHGDVIYNCRINSLFKLNRPLEAEALYKEMMGKRIKPNAGLYHTMISGFCKVGNLEMGKKYFKIMVNRGLKPDSHCYTTLVYSLCEGKDYESALEFCKESISKDWFPSRATITSLVKGLASISKVAEAQELIGLVKEKFPEHAGRWDEIEAGLVAE